MSGRLEDETSANRAAGNMAGMFDFPHDPLEVDV